MIQVKTKHLRAALLFAAKGDARYYLNGVHVHPGPGGGALLVATDGHAAALIRAAATYPAHMPPAGFTLRAASVATAVKLAGKDGVVDLAPDVAGPVTGAGIDATYPDVFRVVPAAVSGEIAHFDPALLARFAEARRLLTGNRDGAVVVGHNGRGPARVSIGLNEFVGVVMPLRRESLFELGDLPAWMLPTDRAQAA